MQRKQIKNFIASPLNYQGGKARILDQLLPYFPTDIDIFVIDQPEDNIDNELNSAPLFIYIKDGKAVEAMSSEFKMVDYKTLNKLVDKYGIE